MASIIKQAIRDILDRAATISDFLHIAVWNDQFNRMETGEGYSFDLPAFFVEIQDMVKNPLLMGVSQSDLVIRLHIGHRQEDAGDGSLDQNLDYFDLRDKVQIAFTLFTPKNCGPMAGYAESMDYEHNNVYHGMLDFTCCFIDTKGSPMDPTDGEWIEKEPPTDLEVVYIEKEKNIFTDEFTDEFQ